MTYLPTPVSGRAPGPARSCCLRGTLSMASSVGPQENSPSVSVHRRLRHRHAARPRPVSPSRGKNTASCTANRQTCRAVCTPHSDTGEGHSQAEDSFPLPEQQLGPASYSAFSLTHHWRHQKNLEMLKDCIQLLQLPFGVCPLLYRCGSLGFLAISGKEGISGVDHTTGSNAEHP